MFITVGNAPLHYLHETDALVSQAAADGITAEQLSAAAGTMTLRISCNAAADVATLTAQPIDGTFTFYDAEQAVRDYMLTHDLAVAAFSLDFTQTVTRNGSTVQYHYIDTIGILFLENRMYDIEADQLVRQQFLTAAEVTLLIVGGGDHATTLHFYAHADEATDEAFTLTRQSSTAANYTVISEYTVSAPDSNGVWMTRYNQIGNNGFIKHVFTFGNRQHTFYRISGADMLRLRFRNRFNLTEYEDLPGTLTHTPSTEKEHALFGDERQDYAIEHTDEYTFVSDPLPREVYPALMDFVRSRHAEVMLGDAVVQRSSPAYREVLITDYEAERTDAPDSPIRLTVTFLVKDSRRRMDSL